MSYPIKYPTPQGANIQIFNAGDNAPSGAVQSWIKPQGASFVWFTLIGAGGGGDGTTGGGSGAVTNCMVPAFLIPDELQVNVGGGQTYIAYSTNITNNTILAANGGGSGAGGAGGSASSSNFFSCMGFFQSVAGQNGGSAQINASPTTFLSAGGGSNPTIANYDYQSSDSGIFQMQPIIVGTGGTNRSASNGGVGCGGGKPANTNGGNGLVVIITW